MKSGENWYHKSTLDIMLHIVSVYPSRDGETEIIAQIINRHNGIYYEIGSFYIPDNQMHLWERI